MKIKSKNKIIVSTLALAMGAALVGSVSGSVAWYQYSTRTTASMTATSAGTSRNLKVRLAGIPAVGQQGQEGYKAPVAATAWKDHIDAEMINTYLKAKRGVETGEANLTPVTSGALTKDAAFTAGNLKAHPVYQYATLPNALGTEYIEIDFEFQLQDNGVDVARDVYLADARLEKSGTKDITEAIRLHFGSGSGENAINKLVAKSATETVVNGKLDLNNNTKDDTDGFSADDLTGNAIYYGGGNAQTTLKQTSYALGHYYDNDSNTETPDVFEYQYGTNHFLVADELTEDAKANAYNLVGGQKLGTTVAAAAANEEQTYLKVTMVMWLEGWALVDNSSIWNYDLANVSFNLDLRFTVAAEK